MPKENHTFELHVETQMTAVCDLYLLTVVILQVYAGVQRVLRAYSDERRGATMLCLQTHLSQTQLAQPK